ncbi:MAG: DEAD/DEAH box helicase [Clostridium paraputrificum]
MKKLNPIEKSKYINEKYKEYLRSSFKFGNVELQSLFEEQLRKEELFKGPYVDLNLPFERGKCIRELIDDWVICKSFLKLSNINFERPLYSHQEESIRRIGKGRSAIITTGTGSGKTESFLYPILNDLMSDIENGNHEVGIRVIFLYPMNALVNDQIDRVRKILANCPDITYGFFTGDTKESVSKVYRKEYGNENDVCIPENELISREEIRENPPHLLFTNYSMLEYLLIRPNDYSIFSPERLKNWKYVVLDEAHSYYGSLGIELSLLMRRLTGLAEKKPRFILTSATLGQKGQSEKEIVNFAKNLTSVVFDEEDIIFSKRILLNVDNIKYKVDGKDYIILKENIKNFNIVKQICDKYKKGYANDVSTCLYELLISDKNVYEIYRVLKDESKNFQSILEEACVSLSDEQLIALIDLINLAEKNGIGLFDLKYHSFVRPLAGAYITYGKEPRLSLTKTNTIDGFKAFEVGNCRYCNSPYIIGKIQNSKDDDLDHLFQNNEVDIYENYGNNEFAKLDYFLIENSINEDEVNKSELEEFSVCSKCGCIHATENLNAKKCDCGDTYEFTVYRVKQLTDRNEEVAFNNINQCPYCEHRANSGIVKSLNLGKDEGTALIAQILLEAIDEGETKVEKSGKLSLKVKKKNSRQTEDLKIKQFLSFSDSRQQASFAATFLTSNHVRMLQKRLIWKVIEDDGYRDVSVDELASILTSLIKKKDLFPNELTAHKNAWITLLVELLNVDGSYDGEGMGLFYFDLDLKDIMDNIDEDDVKDTFGRYNITKKDLETIIQVVFSVFKVTPAINYIKSTLTPDEKMEYLEYRRFDNYIKFNSQKAIRNIRSFLPIKNEQDNKVVRYIKKVCGCSSEEAKDILDIIFNNIAVEGKLLKKHDKEEAYQIDANRYVVKNYKKSKYYQCSKCGKLTPHNVHDVCVKDECDGKLIEVDPDSVMKSNYYRKQYKYKKIESIVIKEHTAQLDRKTAKQYQLDFKNKKINILSCSTTFEMGIDIGDLETVFMRNVPPTPANYVQRAGRAGRRKDSAAYILTYCGTGSHDYTYFTAPEKMISGVIMPPYFNVLNRKIIIRHLMATCLGFFFRRHPEYFKSIDKLVFGEGINEFKQYIGNHPKDLNKYINEKIIPGGIYSEYHDFKWFDKMNGNDEKMEHFVESIKGIAKEYEEAKEFALKNENYPEADSYKKQIEYLRKQSVIELLSKYCVIPKYGFPVDVVELQIYKDGILNNRYDLSRDLKIALSEYAPDSEVIVDGKKYTSKYISLPKSSEFPKHYFCTCSNCKKVNVYISNRTSGRCKYCGESIALEQSEYFIEPINGFKTGVTKESSRMKPKRSYSGEVSYIGGGIKDENHLELGKTIIIETSTDDELLIMNRSDFYMCPVCGYSDIIKSKVRPPQIAKKHKNYRQYDCQNEELKRLRLGHRFHTDVARFTIPLLVSADKNSYSRALSFMYAFLEGVSNVFGIERTDIDGILELNLEEESYDILLYDNVPGGAGHVKRLMDRDAIVKSLIASLNKVSQQCCYENTSCYNCLRNYYNQSHHSQLKRIYAKEFIELLLREIEA